MHEKPSLSLVPKIYFVDDEPIILTIISKSITPATLGLDVEVLTFESANDCLEKLLNDKNTNRLPALIFTDINMPMMSGFQFAKKAMKIFNDLTIDFISAYNYEEYQVEAQNIGIHKYWSKPIDLPQLISYIQKHIRNLITCKTD